MKFECEKPGTRDWSQSLKMIRLRFMGWAGRQKDARPSP